MVVLKIHLLFFYSFQYQFQFSLGHKHKKEESETKQYYGQDIKRIGYGFKPEIS